jgi:hypothetical protein
MGAALLAAWVLDAGWVLFAAMAVYSASTAFTWPAFEAAIARAPGRVPLARRTGLYNVVWSFLGAAGFFAAGALFALDPDAVFWGPLAAHTLELLGLALLATAFIGAQRQSPAVHPGTAERWREGGDPEARARYLRSAWIANGLNYFFFGAFTALAPTLGARLGLGPKLAIWLVSTYLFSRSAAFLLLWLWTAWEHRTPWLAAALLLPPAAFVALFLAPAPPAAIGALAVLGALSGLAYAASLRASLERAGREGEGGGLHEWVIGIGILLGPLAGAAGTRLVPGATTAGMLVAALGAAATVAGLVPLLRATPDR